ncbi:MAG: efflux RND transporter periplasmic adaptor subunit [Planctomycetaceae bacterium]|nr:efflux RND transporter periplasmic adaptor subunit [Planctomycetaceae bacterium]
MRRCCVTLLFLAFFLSQITAAEPDAPRRWRGVFEPRQEALIAAEVSMRVMAMPVKPGQSCRRGDILFVFDETVPRASLAAAEARVAAARLTRDGVRNLFEKNQSTPAELARADSELARAELEYASAERDLASCRVAAPFDGKVVEARVDEHEWANRGSPLLLLVDDAVLKARFFLPEERFAAIGEGEAVRVHVPALGQSFPGVVSRVGVVFDPASRSFDVWADVDNAGDLLRAGMTAEVEWPLGGGQ